MRCTLNKSSYEGFALLVFRINAGIEVMDECGGPFEGQEEKAGTAQEEHVTRDALYRLDEKRGQVRKFALLTRLGLYG